MTYETPKLQHLGSIATLTRGHGGSCIDGHGRAVNQVGGGLHPKPRTCGSAGG